ncbi:alpha/beta fold hydrolase [Fictibacillus phosphorivorans]|uniref:alpha/beta fold hydrolase n=1 Tax=Fictibacillus phosphorivorans TaxID=1221500 RepID=UPI003CEB5A43
MSLTKSILEDSESSYMSTYESSLSLWPVPYKTKYVSTKFGSTHVIESGPESGSPLLLLHGHGFSSTMWYPNIQELSKKYRTYAIDIIGDRNKTIPKVPPENRREYAVWLEEVMNQLNIQTADIAGISYGGLIALNFAINFPKRVGKLIVLSPSSGLAKVKPSFLFKVVPKAIMLSFNKKRLADYLLYNMLQKRYNFHPTYYNQFIAGAVWKNPHKGIKAKKSSWPYVFKDEELKQIEAKTLILVGELDNFHEPKQVIQRANRCINHVQASIVSRSGHLLNMEQSIEVNKRINFFLEKA